MTTAPAIGDGFPFSMVVTLPHNLSFPSLGMEKPSCPKGKSRSRSVIIVDNALLIVT